ncbi:hypothetical protein GN316_13360 [Xylophilus sp. Kf1]|nr:hypothetical protein [Xylophilus sp. Kf1]
MNNSYTIKLSSASAPVQTVEIKAGQQQPAVIPIQGRVIVEMVDAASGRGPQKVVARRVARDLHLAFEGSDPDASDLILQGFYDEPDSHLVGTAEDGGLYEYVPTSGDDEAYVPMLVDGSAGAQALGGLALTAEDLLPALIPASAVAGFSPWLLGALGLGAVAAVAAGGGGGNGGGSGAVEIAATPTQRPDGYLDNVGPIQNPNSTAPVTDDNTPGLHIGALPSGVTGAVLYVDGVRTPSTYDPTTGILTPTVALPDGKHSLGYGLINPAGITPSSPTFELTIDTQPPAAPVLHVADPDGDGRPDITGTGEPGTKVIITDPTGSTHTTTVDPNGRFELEIDMPVNPIGEWRATVTDPAGNVSPPGTTTVNDLIAPIAPVVEGVRDNVGTIVGLVADGGETDDSTPAITGTAEPGSKLTLLDGNDKLIGTTTVDGSGRWTFTPAAPMPDGRYVVSARATDADGNTSPKSAAFVFTIDTIAPGAATFYSLTDDVGSITGPIVNGTVTDDTRPTMSGTAEPATIVTIKDGATVIGSTIVDAAGNWTFTPTVALLEGSHSWTATVSDRAGNTAPATTPITFVVDTTAPTTATIITSVVDDQGTSTGPLVNSVATITDDARPAISGTAEAGTTVIVKDGTLQIGTAAVDANGRWTFTPTATLLNGVHHITAAAMDKAGNVGPASLPFDFTLVTGGIASAPAITNVIDDVGILANVSPDGVTNDPTPTVQGTARPGHTVRLFSETGALLGTALADANGQWSITAPALPDGPHSFNATATDSAGNVSLPTAAYRIVIDTLAPARPTDPTGITEPPTLTDNVGARTGPISNGTTTDDATPTFSGKAEPGATVTVKDGLVTLGTAPVDAAGNWTFTPAPPLADGAHSLTALVTDPAGNVSGTTTPINFIVDTRAVVVSIDQVLDDVGTFTGLLASGASTDDKRPTVSGEATPGGLVRLYVDGVAVPGATATADSTGHWTITPSADLGQGQHLLTATVATAANGESAQTAPFTLTVDSVAPAAPALVSVTDDVGSSRGLVAAGTPSDDTTPTLRGTAEANSRVTILDGGQPIGTTMADAFGNWTFTPASPLNDGSHPITLTATDAAGNVSPPSTPWAVLIDTTAPTIVPVITSVIDDQGSSTGALVSGVATITDDARPAISGTSEPNGSVVIRDGNVQIGTAAVDAAGLWTFTPTAPLLNGIHHITATALDQAGNVGPTSLPFDFTLIAGHAPTAPAITNVIDDVGTVVNIEPYGLTNDPTPTVKGTALNGSVVTLFDETGAVLGTAATDANGQWSITTPALPDGPHSFSATASNVAGNVSKPTGVYPITIDTQTPSAATSPALSDNVGRYTGPITDGMTTDDATPAFTGKAEPGATVSIQDGLIPLGTALVDASGNWTFTPGIPLADGAHAFSATVTDPAGNVSPTTTPIRFTVDTSSVVVAINTVTDDVDPLSGALISGASTNDRRPTVEGSATPGGRVQLYVDGTAVAGATATADGAGRWTITPGTDLAQGLHLLTATVTTAAAGESPATAPFTLTVDSVAPATPAIVSSRDDVGLYQGNLPDGAPTDDTTPSLSGTAEPHSRITVMDAGQFIGTAMTDAAGHWTFTPASPLNGDGPHTITVTATDAAGNVSSPSAPWTVLIDTSRPAAPVIVSDIDNQGIYTGNLPSGTPSDDITPTLSGTAEPNTIVTIKDAGTPIGTAAVDASGAWTFTPTFLPGNSTHPITVTSTDASGNESTPASFTVVIDTVPPATPTIVASDDNFGIYTGNIPSGTPTNDTTPTLSGQAEPDSLVSIFDGARLLGTATANAAGLWAFTTPALVGEGAHPITVTATDAAGNVSQPSLPWEVRIDTIAPDIPSISASNDNVALNEGDIASGIPTNDPTPRMSGAAEPESLVSIFDGGVLQGTTMANALGEWNFTPTLAGQGTHAITVTSTDAAGNVSGPSAIWNVVVDTIAPDAPGISLSQDNVGIYQGDIAAGQPTNDATPTMSGKAEPNSLVSLYDNGTFAGSARVDASGNWSYEPTLTGEGKHAITATSTDAAGNVSPRFDAWNVELDTTPPAFTTNANAAVNENTAAGTVIYTAGSTDATGVTYGITGGADASRFSINATTGQVTMNFRPDYEAPADAGGNNVYDYVITATDAAGNQSSQDASLTVVNVSERATITTTLGGGGLWVMSAVNNATVRNNFIVGRLSSDIPVTYTTNLDFIRVTPDGVIYTHGDRVGVGALNSGHDYLPMHLYGTTNPNGNAMFVQMYRAYPITITATTASGEVTVINTTISAYSNLGAPAGYPNFITPANYLPPFIPPVALDLNHDGHVSYSNTAVDINGNGLAHTTAWVAKDDGVLVWDKYHDGKVHDSSQFAFAQYLAGARTDLEGLKAFDTNRDGKLDSADTIWNELRVWQDQNGNGVSDAGEVKTLAAHGITSIGLTSDGVATNPADGVHEAGKASATLADGSRMVVADVSFDTKNTAEHPGVAAHPFILDLNHDGRISYDKSLVDITGTGVKELVAWAGKDDGVLVWDKHHDGQVHDSSQYSFGTLSGDNAGQQGLKLFDTNGDGKLDRHDALWKELGVWQAAADGGGSIQTLAQLGIESISLDSDGVTAKPAQGVTEAGKTSATLSNGQTMAVVDATVSYLPADTPYPPSYLDQNQHHAVI